MAPTAVVQLVTPAVGQITQPLQKKTAGEAQEEDHKVGEETLTSSIPFFFARFPLICLAVPAPAVITGQPFANHLSAVPSRAVRSPLTAGQAAGAGDAEQDQGLRRSNGASCSSSGQTGVCSSSPVRADVNAPLGEVTLSPVKRPRGVPTLMTSPVFGGTSPGRRSHRSSPSKEGGHSPARLSPGSRSPLTGKLRTPSPVQRKAGRYSPARNSKSWFGFQRAPSPKMEGGEVLTAKSLSVPNLIVYLDQSRLGLNLCPGLCCGRPSW